MASSQRQDFKPSEEARQHPSTTALIDELDKRLIVVLRDGRKLIGTLRSFDQFANIVLEGCCERVYVGRQYGDVPLGLYIIRGENVMLLAALDLAKEEEISARDQVSMEDIVRLRREELEREGAEEKRAKNILLGDDGFY